MIKRDALFNMLADGAAVITANNRLAIHLQQEFFDNKQRAMSDKPACFPYQLFLQQTFHQYSKNNTSKTLPVLLTEQQMHYLWLQILKNQSVSINQGLLDAVKEAWKRCHQWQLDFEHPAFSIFPQTRLFQQWALDLQTKLTQLSAICDEQLAYFLIKEQAPLSKSTFIWLCFDDYTPQQRDVQLYMAAQGHKVLHSDLTEQDNKPSLYAALDEEDEFQQLIIWLQKQLILKDKQRIAVVVPDLENKSKKLSRLLENQLPSVKIDLSIGEAFCQYPLISHALCWLNLNHHTLTAEQASLLLHSPYLIAAKTEFAGRVQLFQESTCIGEQCFEQKRLLKEMETLCPLLAEALKNLNEYPQTASPSKWAELFTKRLQMLGFPGEYALNSAAFQYYQRFVELLEEFRQLQFVSPLLNQDEALRAFKYLADNTLFQPKKSGTQVQILGLLESSGCVYDHVWVMGMNDECLPQKARLSAFIPIELQQQLHMPFACPERELMLARKQLDRLKKSAANCVFSYPQFAEDRPSLACPLLVDIEPYKAEPIQIMNNPSLLEKFQDGYFLPPQHQEIIKGGSSILANQAKCPFRAFVSHRLHIKPKRDPIEGLNHLERGQIIHKVMEIIWLQLRDQYTLLTLPEYKLQQVIRDAIYAALLPFSEQNKVSFSPLIRQVEEKRLTQLVYACLEWEKKRPDFVVEAIEQSYTLNLADMEFKLRIDRLDRVAGDYKWVIDYKSSIPSALPWKEERPREPQLLMYSLLDKAINTLVFVNLRDSQVIIKGLSEENYEQTQISVLKDESWSNSRNNWQIRLNNLVEEFKQGFCLPQPINPGICQQCDFDSICRYKN